MFVTVMGGIFTLVGAAMAILAFRRGSERRAFLAGSTTATGEVVGLAEIPDGGEISYRPRVRFRAEGGQEITFESGMGSDRPLWSVGGSVVVLYQPEEPRAAEIASFAALWLPTILHAALGVVFLAIGLGLLVGRLPV